MRSERERVYNTRDNIGRPSAVGCTVKRWVHRGCCSSVLRCDLVTHFDMLLVRYTEETTHANQLALILQKSSELSGTAPSFQILLYVLFSRPFESLHLFINFESWWNEIRFRAWSRFRHHVALFINWHCVDNSGILTRD